MSNVVIKVEELSKQYKLGKIGTGSVAHDLNRWWHRVRGKEDPYLKIGETNDRTSKGESDYVWSLRDINFSIDRGEAVGIIGRNGAGKSTLLKILSRTTAPTEGRIKIKGRVASLLEVGTGFHPELTGRENIFLNGAILGMTKAEIKSKFDEIVDFAGVERYIDTPVKRYSSGMYVRLAFGVAAHLEPEILIVDEVLAVGDAEFQKKCLGKMQDVAGHGRTVLFVSHNMTAIQALCNRCIYLKNGSVMADGPAAKIVNDYLHTETFNKTHEEWDNMENAPGNEYIRVKRVKIGDMNEPFRKVLDISRDLRFEVEFWNNSGLNTLLLGADLMTIKDEYVFSSGTKIQAANNAPSSVNLQIPSHLLNDSSYKIKLYFFDEHYRKLFVLDEAVVFDMADGSKREGYLQKINGVVRPKLKWGGNILS